MSPEFLNVDLELESKESLDVIAQEFGEKVHILYNDRYTKKEYRLSLEIYAGDDHDPDSIINAFCDLIEVFSRKAKGAWSKASARRFDIGIVSGKADEKKFKALILHLKPATLKRAAKLDAQIVLTVYPFGSVAKKKKK